MDNSPEAPEWQGAIARPLVIVRRDDAIDGLAEVVTGDRKRFHLVSPRTPGPDLPPGKWRTVE